jgi:hypothetical protein
MMMCAQHRGQFRAQMLKNVHQLLRLDWVDDGCLGGLFIENNVCVVVYEVVGKEGSFTNGPRKRSCVYPIKHLLSILHRSIRSSFSFSLPCKTGTGMMRIVEAVFVVEAVENGFRANEAEEK